MKLSSHRRMVNKVVRGAMRAQTLKPVECPKLTQLPKPITIIVLYVANQIPLIQAYD